MEIKYDEEKMKRIQGVQREKKDPKDGKDWMPQGKRSASHGRE